MVIFEARISIEQQLKELEKRRKRGMRLLAEVARRVGVTRQLVLRWTKLTERGELIRALKDGALAAGFVSELWTLPRIATVLMLSCTYESLNSSHSRWSGSAPSKTAADS
jgi:hypothetical protein